MNKYVGTVLLLFLLILPAGLVIAFSYSGASHPIERNILMNDEFLEASDNDVEILFFGFAGCATVCPLSLNKIADVLESDKVKKNQSRVGGLFVEVKSTLEETGDAGYADSYSTAFSPGIRGYTPDLKTYRHLAEEFILRIYESRDSTGQISHTDHFFVLRRISDQWVIDRVLKNTIEMKQLADIVSQSANKRMNR